MWLQTVRGFYSATETAEDAEMLQVRARDKQDLENLRPFIPGMRILHTPERDYEWRIIVAKEEWADVVSQLILDISYNNFKDEVTKVQGHARHDIYMAAWSVFGRIGKPYRNLHSFGRTWESLTLPRDKPWEDDGITKEEWDAQTDAFLEATGVNPVQAAFDKIDTCSDCGQSITRAHDASGKCPEEKVSFNGRSPVPAHWESAKKRNRKRNRNRKR